MINTIVTALGGHWVGIIIIVLLIVIALTKPKIDLSKKSLSFRENKRSCGDCIQILQGMRTSFELAYNLKLNSILRLQMVYVEQKLEEIAIIIKYPVHDSIKNEIRRSFKENGFCELTEEQYTRYLDSRYDYFNTALNNNSEEIKTIVKDIYDHAKEVKLRIEAEIKDLEDKFSDDLNNLVKE